MSGLFVFARKVNDMEFATTRGRHIKTISEVRCQTKNTITSERKKVKHMNKLQLIDADTLYYKPLARPKMLIDGVLSDGLAILAGDSKDRQELDGAVAVPANQPRRGSVGLPTRKTDVVHLALEDREWRVQQRIHRFFIRRDNEHGICVAMALDSPYLPIRKGRAL